MKPFALINTLLTFFSGVTVTIGIHLYREPCEYFVVVFASEYLKTYTLLGVGGVVLFLGSLGCVATLESNLRWRCAIHILYSAVILVLIISEMILGLWLVLHANSALAKLPPKDFDPNLKQFLEEVSLNARVDWMVVAWLGSMCLLQLIASVVAAFESRCARRELRLRRRRRQSIRLMNMK